MTPSCSIVISSYNKAEYVGLAVGSALAQTYPGVEVVVIDDGSTDQSLAILRQFGQRIRLEAKPNGGQASAMNRGYAVSVGEIVFFLDCDDVLEPDTVERVVKLWTAALSKVHFRLRRIGPAGTETGGPPLPPYSELPAGNLLPMLHRFGFYSSPPTSGNAFARRFLDRVMPIDETVHRNWPDTYLIGTAPLFGEVGVVAGFGGSWRETETNQSKQNIQKLGMTLQSDLAYIDSARELAASAGDAKRIPAKWPQHLKNTLIVARLGGAAASRKRAISVVKDYLQTIWTWPEYSTRVRVRFTVWALAISLLPVKLLRLIPGVAGPNVRLT